MIIKSVDFSKLFDTLRFFFNTHLDKKRLSKIEDQLMENIRILADANFKCYQANMTVIAERKKDKVDTRLISDMELQARTVGERRVKAKTAINSLLNSIYPLTDKKKVEPESLINDDIVYSVGEMIDRLTIEQIKMADYQSRLNEGAVSEATEMVKKIKQSQLWSERVRRYLELKLQEIEQKGFYEYVEEMRTYDLSGIRDVF